MIHSGIRLWWIYMGILQHFSVANCLRMVWPDIFWYFNVEFNGILWFRWYFIATDFGMTDPCIRNSSCGVKMGCINRPRPELSRIFVLIWRCLVSKGTLSPSNITIIITALQEVTAGCTCFPAKQLRKYHALSYASTQTLGLSICRMTSIYVSKSTMGRSGQGSLYWIFPRILVFQDFPGSWNIQQLEFHK